MKEKINVGVVGLGVGFHHAINVMRHNHFNLKSVCDFDLSKLKNFQKKYKNIFCTNDANQILCDKSISVIIIASYDKYHAKYILKSLKNNKHVFVEKPICKNLKEIEKIKKFIKNKKLIISSNFVLRAHPAVLYLKKIIKKNILGKIYYIETAYNYGRLKKITSGWRSLEKNYSIFLGGGIHMFDLIFYLFPNLKISTYNKITNKIVTKYSKFQYDDFEILNIKFENSIIAQIVSNFGCAKPHSHALKVYGDNGTFEFNDQKIIIYVKKHNNFKKYSKKISKSHIFKHKILKTFLDHIVNKKKCTLVNKQELLSITENSLKINEKQQF
jgi:predicted dehydrogenase